VKSVNVITSTLKWGGIMYCIIGKKTVRGCVGKERRESAGSAVLVSQGIGRKEERGEGENFEEDRFFSLERFSTGVPRGREKNSWTTNHSAGRREIWEISSRKRGKKKSKWLYTSVKGAKLGQNKRRLTSRRGPNISIIQNLM